MIPPSFRLALDLLALTARLYEWFYALIVRYHNRLASTALAENDLFYIFPEKIFPDWEDIFPN